MMPSRATRIALAPRSIGFDRRKYGRELLIDAAMVSRIPRFIVDSTPHALGFFDTLLVTRGRGEIRIDGAAYDVKPGTVLFCIPGEVREWRLTRPLDGACLFFAEAFITDIFSDARFLRELAFFATPRTSRVVELNARQRRQFLARFTIMQRELKTNQPYASHRLRAALYELLVLLNRWYVAAHGARPPPPTSLVRRFQSLVERHVARRHADRQRQGVAQFASRLGVSPGHLNALCRTHIRQSAGAVIRSGLVMEARRLLLYSELNAEQIARRLGFEDPAYFSRFFRREAGSTPTQFRNERS